MKLKLTRSQSLPNLSLSKSTPSTPKSTPSTPRSAPSTPTQSRAPRQPEGDRFVSASGSRPPAPTKAELQNAKNSLRRTDYGVVHPELPGIRTRRGHGESAHEFTDLTADARASTHRLMSQPNGRRMLEELNGSTQRLNPGEVGTPARPLTAVDIFSGRNASLPMGHVPRNDGTLASARPAYRYDGTPSAGTASKITYDETAAQGGRFNSLGHEMVHGWRAANGLQVSPLELSPQRNAPVIQQDATGTVGRVIGHHAHMREEFETVGLRPTPHAPQGWAPSENMIRQEHGLPARRDYSGQTPAGTDSILKNIDEATDNRSWLQKTFGNEPTPVGRIVNHLEG
jgi:hypothetical protein